MTKGVKILLGCGAVAFLGAVVVVVALVGGAFWVKGKAEKFSGEVAAKAQEIESYTKKANANSFTEPAGGVLQEERLVKYLDVRKGVFAVYEAHRSEIESLNERTKDKKELSVSETFEAASLMARLVSDIRLAQMKGLAADGMNEAEYTYITQAVYKSAWASMAEQEQNNTGQQPAETMKQGADQMAKMPGGEALAEQMRQGAELMRAPEENVRLFRKYEADIKKYAMSGLGAIGL